jgi:hypothetical protein
MSGTQYLGASLGLQAVSQPIKTVSAAYTINPDTDSTIISTSTSVITLPAASTCEGQSFTVFFQVAGGAFATNGSDGIHILGGGSTTFIEANNGQSITVTSSGTAWFAAVYIQIDASAGDIQPIGINTSAGSIGLAADSGHVHDLGPSGFVNPASTSSGTAAQLFGLNVALTPGTYSVDGMIVLNSLTAASSCTVSATFSGTSGALVLLSYGYMGAAYTAPVVHTSLTAATPSLTLSTTSAFPLLISGVISIATAGEWGFEITPASGTDKVVVSAGSFIQCFPI